MHVPRPHSVAGQIGGAALVGIGVAALIDGPSDFVGHLKAIPTSIQRAFRDPHQSWFVATHPTKPWITDLAYSVSDDARSGELRTFGTDGSLDGNGDAFRHAFAAAIFVQRAVRDHSMSAPKARDLVIAAGEAHERDGMDNGTRVSADMDRFNNRAGAFLAGTARDTDGSWLTEAQIETIILGALSDGELRRVDASGTSLTPSTASDDDSD